MSSKTLKIIIQFHSFQAIPTGPAVTVFVGNITERAPDSMVCNYINIKDDCKIQFLFSQGSASFDNRRTCRELEESARSHWKAAGGWLWLAVYLLILEILTRAMTIDDELLPEFKINYFRLLVFASTATQMPVKDRLD